MKAKKWFVNITLLLGVILLIWILPLGHDLWFHLYRIGAMATEIKMDPFHLPIRILSETFNGYGYGAPLYYGDTFLYIPALLVAMGLDVVWTYKLFTVFLWIGTYYVAKYSAKIILDNERQVILFAYVYTFSACFVLDLCIRSAIGESLAMMFLPLVFSSFYGLLYKDKDTNQYGRLLAISMTAVAVSHVLSLLWCGIILCIWAMIEWKKVFQSGKWMKIVTAAILMIGISASFLFPMLEQMLYQKVQTAGNNDYQKEQFMNYGIEWMDYFISYDVKKIVTSVFDLSWDIEYWHPGGIGIFAILLVGCISYYKISVSKNVKLVLISALSVLISLGIVPIMNLAKEVFSFMQFSWRVLPFVTVALAFVALKVVEVKDDTAIEWILYIGTFLVAISIIAPRYGYQLLAQQNDSQLIRETNPDLYDKYQFKYDKNAADAMYLPENVYKGTYEKRGDVVSVDKDNLKYNWQRVGKEIHVSIERNPNNEVSMELPLYIYKGYVAINENGEKLIPKRSEDGLVLFEIGDYEGELVVCYEGTICQRISDVITVLAGTIFIIISCRKRKIIL